MRKKKKIVRQGIQNYVHKLFRMYEKDPSLTANSLKKWITADLAVRE